MVARCLVLALLLASAACSSPAEVAERTGVEAKATASARASAQGAAKSVEEDSDLYSYAFSYPAAVGAIPRLAAVLQQRADTAKGELVAEAKAARAESEAGGFPFNPHSYSAEWQVVADLPGWLSLSNKFATYSGGAHGMYGLEGLVWDKANGRALASQDLFVSADYLGSVMGGTLCDALDRERRARGMELPPENAPVFPRCPGTDEATILVGSSNGRTFDRITVWYGPYVAGSYAEGAYELDFPMTEAMIAAVKPAYRAAFSAGR